MTHKTNTVYSSRINDVQKINSFKTNDVQKTNFFVRVDDMGENTCNIFPRINRVQKTNMIYSFIMNNIQGKYNNSFVTNDVQKTNFFRSC